MRLLTAGEDLPNAYRIIPVLPQHLRHNNVAVKHPLSGEVCIFPCWALLFGFASSVFQFERFSFFLEAVGRRALHLMVSLFVDDSHLDELDSAGGHGQALWTELATSCGQPFNPTKAQDLSARNTFWGILHVTSGAFTEGHVVFQAKDTIISKAINLIHALLQAGSTTPSQASKIRGVCGFVATAQWGRVGRAPMSPLRRRQYSDKPPWRNSFELCRAFELLLMLMQVVVPRSVQVTAAALNFIVVASDAQADDHPSGGVLIFDPVSGSKTGGYLKFSQWLLSSWGYPPAVMQAGGNPIALCECAMLPVALMNFSYMLRGRDVLWLCDNTSALYSVVTGTARSPQLDRIVAVFHFVLYFLKMRCWFEWINSDSNFSDAGSAVIYATMISAANMVSICVR